MTDDEKLSVLISHISDVRKNGIKMGERWAQEGRKDEARILIANSFIHDNSKFYGIEWEHLWPDNPNKEALRLAIQQHNTTNFHHPESKGKEGIHKMCDVYLGEMVLDWKSRSSEFGTSLIDWIDDKATKRFKFKTSDPVYIKIMYFVDLLLDKPFISIPLKEKK